MTRAADADRPVYSEPARTFAAAIGLAALIVIGFVIDLALGGAATHLFGFILIFVIVVGIEVLAVVAARSTRSITVTESELTVGEHSVSRDSIIGYERDVMDAASNVLGRSPGEGLPRGSAGLAVHLADGSTLVVPTRYPTRLAHALQVSLTRPGVRLMEPDDEALLVEVEERSDVLFRVAGYGDLPDPVHAHERRDPLVVLVAGQPIVAFARLDEVDGLAHLEQLSVLPGQQRQGVGRELVEAVCTWAVAHGYSAMTLTTFEKVPWNAPLFAKLGFVPVSELTPGLSEVRDWERVIGLDAIGPRVVMRRELVAGHDDAPRTDPYVKKP